MLLISGMNDAEAERAFERGWRELQENKNYKKALTFFVISNRLSSSEEKRKLIEECKENMTNSGTRHSRLWKRVKTCMANIKNSFLQYERRFILPAHKQLFRDSFDSNMFGCLLQICAGTKKYFSRQSSRRCQLFYLKRPSIFSCHHLYYTFDLSSFHTQLAQLAT